MVSDGAVAPDRRFDARTLRPHTVEEVELLRREPSKVALVGVRVLFIVLLVASLPNIHQSPYIWTSAHVPEGHVSGFEVAFDRIDRSLPLMGTRHTGGGYRDAIYGAQRARSSNVTGKPAPPSVLNAGNYTEHYNQTRYLVVSDRDVERDLSVFPEPALHLRGSRLTRRTPPPAPHYLEAAGLHLLRRRPGDGVERDESSNSVQAVTCRRGRRTRHR